MAGFTHLILDVLIFGPSVLDGDAFYTVGGFWVAVQSVIAYGVIMALLPDVAVG